MAAKSGGMLRHAATGTELSSNATEQDVHALKQWHCRVCLGQRQLQQLDDTIKQLQEEQKSRLEYEHLKATADARGQDFQRSMEQLLLMAAADDKDEQQQAILEKAFQDEAEEIVKKLGTAALVDSAADVVLGAASPSLAEGQISTCLFCQRQAHRAGSGPQYVAAPTAEFKDYVRVCGADYCNRLLEQLCSNRGHATSSGTSIAVSVSSTISQPRRSARQIVNKMKRN
jgi:hypothetical protein